MMTRRQALKTTALATAAAATVRGTFAQGQPGKLPITGSQPLITTATGPFTLPPLPYAFDALEPHINARTMEIHHDKHHAAYVANLNKVLPAWTDVHTKFDSSNVEELLRNFIPEKIRNVVLNNGGGHYNHSLFWQMMKKDGGGEPKTELAKAIDIHFGSFSGFKDQFAKAALGQFGSGWAWLAIGTLDKKLVIKTTANQDSTLSVYNESQSPIQGLQNHSPLLGLDVWEHAYYLKYQNKRADYITAWWNVVNWDFVAERYSKLK